MQAQDLKGLLDRSSSSRAFFLSQPVDIQMSLHAYNKHIHTAFELHQYTDFVKQDKRLS